MSWFSNDNDQALTAEQKLFNSIDEYLDERFGFFSYFNIRGVVKSAMDNTLKKDYPQIPYSAAEIIAWARWNDDESILMTPGGQAIEGEEFSNEIFGAPKVNPETGKKNTQAQIDGAIVSAAKSAAGGLSKTVLLIAALGLGYAFLSSKAKKLGGK